MKRASKVSKAADVVTYRPKASLTVDAKDLPAIKDWKVGKSYELCVMAKMVSLSAGDEYSLDEDADKTPRARFVITDVKEEKY